MPRCGLLDFFLLDSGDREAFRCEDLLGDFDTVPLLKQIHDVNAT